MLIQNFAYREIKTTDIKSTWYSGIIQDSLQGRFSLESIRAGKGITFKPIGNQ